MSKELKEEYGNIDQLVVRVGKACNFKCDFCNVTDNEKNVKLRESVNDIIRNFHYKLKYSHFDDNKIIVTISGGEPSIFQKETIFALKYIKTFLFKKNINTLFEIQTNASNIDFDFAKKLYDNGIKTALVSFHTNEKEIFEKTIGVSYDSYFSKIDEGIKNLYSNGIIVDINMIISKKNTGYYFSNMKYLLKAYPFINNYNIGVVQPHGDALKNFSELSPKYTDIYDEYNRVLFYLKSVGKEVTSHFVGLPACYIGLYGNSLEVFENTVFRKNFNFSKKYLINNINDSNKKQLKECNNCLFNNVCSGIWNEYEGYQTLKPKAYLVDFHNNFIKNDYCYKVEDINQNGKYIYDNNIRQVIIKSSLGSKEEIYGLLKYYCKLGFYKVSLLIDSDMVLESDIFLTGVTTIQLDIERVEVDFIFKLISFSLSFKPQFRINIDILVKNYSKNNILKIKNIIKCFPSDYVKLYFVYNFINKEVLKYIIILNLLLHFKNNIYTVNFFKDLNYKLNYYE